MCVCVCVYVCVLLKWPIGNDAQRAWVGQQKKGQFDDRNSIHTILEMQKGIWDQRNRLEQKKNQDDDTDRKNINETERTGKWGTEIQQPQLSTMPNQQKKKGEDENTSTANKKEENQDWLLTAALTADHLSFQFH